MADSPIVPTNAVQVMKHEDQFGHYLSLGNDVRLAEGLILHEAQVVAAVLNRHWDAFVAAFQRDKAEAVVEADHLEGEVEEEVATVGEEIVTPVESEVQALETSAEKLEHEGTPDAPVPPSE